MKKKQGSADGVQEGLEDKAWKTGLGDGPDTRSIFLEVLHMRYCALFRGK